MFWWQVEAAAIEQAAAKPDLGMGFWKPVRDMKRKVPEFTVPAESEVLLLLRKLS